MLAESKEGRSIRLTRLGNSWLTCCAGIILSLAGCQTSGGAKKPQAMPGPSNSEPLPPPPGSLTAFSGDEPPFWDSAPEASGESAARLPGDTGGELLEPADNENSQAPDHYPIDLPTALRLAGANSLQVALAAARVQEAYAEVKAADANWLPSLRGGVVYNKHDGRIQATEGTVLEANRGSLFVGGGVGLGQAPLNGGSGGPARLFVDLSVSDLLFEPLAARQMADAACADEAVVFNRTVLEAGQAYIELQRARLRLAVYEEAVQNAELLARITRDFAASGEGFLADAERSAVELVRWRRLLLQAEEELHVASARLVRIVRLAATTTLYTTDGQAVAIDLIGSDVSLHDLIAQAISARPELGRHAALADATRTRVDEEHWRPWLPHVYAGVSGGRFGGNEDSNIKNDGDRSDFDLAAVWELDSFGLGNAARRQRADSRYRQANLAAEQMQDLIAEEVTRAYRRVAARRQQVDVTQPQLAAATRALELNLDGIRGAVLRPIEAQQAITALAGARLQSLDVVLDYNAAQLTLLYAVGTPPTGDVIQFMETETPGSLN